jgi:serine/threonine-protein kinase
MVAGESGSSDIWIGDLVRGTLNRLTAEGIDTGPIWTPDGKRVVFFSQQRQMPGIYWAPVDGSGKVEPLVASVLAIPDGWTPDGKTLLYESAGTVRIWAMTLPTSGGDGKPRMLSEPGAFNERAAEVSPDGRWMAYVSDESGKNQVYVRPFPGPGGKAPISIEAGEDPRWSADGREIFYFDPVRNQVMAVAIEGAASVRAGQPHALFEQRDPNWDVTPDGKRFLVRRQPQNEASQARLQVVVNWFDELTRKVPAGKSGAVR